MNNNWSLSLRSSLLVREAKSINRFNKTVKLVLPVKDVEVDGKKGLPKQ